MRDVSTLEAVRLLEKVTDYVHTKAVLNVVAGVGRMSMDKVTRGVMPFMTAQFLIMFLMVLFPWLVTGPAKLFHGGP